MSVVPECHATTNDMDDRETDFSITLSNTNSLKCVEGYQIQFNGHSKNVPLCSPSAHFTITGREGQPVQNEIVVYTLDYENRRGNLPCNFNIAGKFRERYHALPSNRGHDFSFLLLLLLLHVYFVIE